MCTHVCPKTMGWSKQKMQASLQQNTRCCINEQQAGTKARSLQQVADNAALCKALWRPSATLQACIHTNTRLKPPLMLQQLDASTGMQAGSQKASFKTPTHEDSPKTPWYPTRTHKCA
jgi:hypothetical protein